MSYLRFSRFEYRAIFVVYHALHLDREPLYRVRRRLAGALAEPLPELAERVGRFRPRAMRILCNHFRPRPKAEHGLVPEELLVLAVAGLDLLLHARFLGPLRRALVEHLRGEHPALASKLERLSLHQFETVCRQVRCR